MPLTRRTSWLAAALLLWSSLAPAAPPVRPLELSVDATDAPRGIFHARLVVPASPGPMALAYPKWIQGEHTPSGPITQLVGLSIKAGGAVVPWRRDPIDQFLFRLEVAAFDWHGFFTARFYDIAPKIPLGGVEGSGWTLVYDARPNGFQRAWDTMYKQVDQTMSIGLQLSPIGVVQDVVLDSAAWKGGFGPGMTIVSVNGRPFTPAAFEEQLNAATSAAGAIEFLVRHGEDAKTLRIDYHGGVRYPHLERNPLRPDVLAAILAPRAGR